MNCKANIIIKMFLLVFKKNELLRVLNSIFGLLYQMKKGRVLCFTYFFRKKNHNIPSSSLASSLIKSLDQGGSKVSSSSTDFTISIALIFCSTS